MLIQVDWHVPGRVILVRYSGRLSAMQQEHTAEMVLDLIKSAKLPPTQRVHLLWDMQDIHGIRSQLVELVGATRLLAHLPRLGHIIIHGQHTQFLQAFADFLRPSLGVPVHFFHAASDAMQQLLRLDDTLSEDMLRAS
jgi:hypothetical protein